MNRTPSEQPVSPTPSDPSATEPADRPGSPKERHPLNRPNPGIQVTVLMWCLWLLGAWLTSLTIDGSAPASRWMIFASLTGLMALWPALRLSRLDGVERLGAPAISVIFVEWLCLIMVFQAVIWPLRVMAGWPVPQVLWIDAAVVAWSLLTAGVVAWGTRFKHSGLRTLAMVLCMLLFVGEPVVMLAVIAADLTPSGWMMRVSPLQTVWELSAPHRMLEEANPWGATVVGALVAAGIVWLAVIGGGFRARTGAWSDDIE